MKPSGTPGGTGFNIVEPRSNKKSDEYGCRLVFHRGNIKNIVSTTDEHAANLIMSVLYLQQCIERNAMNLLFIRSRQVHRSLNLKNRIQYISHVD